MMTDVVEHSSGPTVPEPDQPSVEAGDTAGARTGTGTGTGTGTVEPTAAARIVQIRERIDEIDHALISLWQERAALSQEVGVTRMASGGTRLVLSREREILERFRGALGADGTQLALLLLRAGRGPL
ncbi:chorismate mutase [Micromonospora profundi]